MAWKGPPQCHKEGVYWQIKNGNKDVVLLDLNCMQTLQMQCVLKVWQHWSQTQFDGKRLFIFSEQTRNFRNPSNRNKHVYPIIFNHNYLVCRQHVWCPFLVQRLPYIKNPSQNRSTAALSNLTSAVFFNWAVHLCHLNIPRGNLYYILVKWLVPRVTQWLT